MKTLAKRPNESGKKIVVNIVKPLLYPLYVYILVPWLPTYYDTTDNTTEWMTRVSKTTSFLTKMGFQPLWAQTVK